MQREPQRPKHPHNTRKKYPRTCPSSTKILVTPHGFPSVTQFHRRRRQRTVPVFGVHGVVESRSVDDCQSQFDALLFDLHILLLYLDRLLNSLYTHTTIGDRTFAVAGPRAWNSLPPAVRSSLPHTTPSKRP